MNPFAVMENDILNALKESGLTTRQAEKTLREAREISATTGAEMLALHGIVYERGFNFLNSAPPQIEAGKPARVSARRVFALLFWIAALLNIGVFVFGKNDFGTAFRIIIFAAAALYLGRTVRN